MNYYKIVDYQYVVQQTNDRFTDSINSLIERGYIPKGPNGFNVVDANVLLTQVMIKLEKAEHADVPNAYPAQFFTEEAFRMEP